MKIYIFSFIALTALISGCEKSAIDKSPRPNILFAIADDASWKHFGAYGCDWVQTPAFDRVAENGILFTRAYTPNAKCAPSRSCILTGRNSWQLEEAANHSPHFPAKFKTYAEALGENGYWVGSVAKGWAPGDPGEKNGERRQLTGPKFDEFKTDPPARYINNIDYARNFEAFLEERPEGQPFCFWYGSTEPHRAYEFEAGIKKGGKSREQIDEVPSFWPDVDTVRTDMLDYAFEIEYFDSHLQKMLQKLEEIGELDNTLVIVTADNGMPFPRIKGQVYEYSNHLPLAIMWPDGIKNPGRAVTDFVNFIDFTPTFLEVAGLSVEEAGMQPVTGKSLTDIFYSEKEGDVVPGRDFVLVGKERHDVGRPDDVGYPVRGIINDGFLYLRNFKTDRWPAGNPETGYLNTDGSPTKTYVLDTRRKKGIMEFWQLNFGKRPAEELYNIDEDPYCMNNLADLNNFDEIKAKLSDELINKLKAQNDPRIFGKGDVFDNYEYSGAVRNFYNRYMSGEDVPAGWVNKSDFEKDELIIYPAPEEEKLSEDYTLEVNGQPVDIYLAKIADVENPDSWLLKPEDVGGPYSFTYFDFSGEVTIKITALKKPLDNLVIRPLSTGIIPEVNDNTLTFKINQPCKLSIEPDGRIEPLILFANAPEINPPDEGDENVVYFGPGIHKPEKIELSSGQTLYIAGGAIVKGGVAAKGDNITIKGRGILCGNDWAWRKGPGSMIRVTEASNVSVEGIILRGSWGWTIPIYNSDSVSITNVKLVCSKNPNDDGINPCNSRRIYIRDCFIRTDDDCIAMKGIRRGSDNDNVEYITVENCLLWADRARVFLLGHESRAEYMRHIILRDLDILHFNMTPFLFEPGEEMSIEDVVVENVTANADYPNQSGERSFNLICLRPVVNQYMHDKVPGKISNIQFKNISLTGEEREAKYTVWVKGADPDHKVSNVTFENITWFNHLLSRNSPQVSVEENTKNIRFLSPDVNERNSKI